MYLELKPNELIRDTDKFDEPNLPGQEARCLGWQESLTQLANLFDPEIPD